MDFILLLFVAAALGLNFPKRDFYLVEIRHWRDGTMTSHARNYAGYDRIYLKKSTLKIFSKSKECFILHNSNGGIIKVDQLIFSSLDAAKIYYESLKPLAKTSEGAIELNLWRVVARTRGGAHVTPPNSYASREAISLERCQPHFPVKAESVPETGSVDT